jgi:RNA polymerase sigma factor (sigma-70 family)
MEAVIDTGAGAVGGDAAAATGAWSDRSRWAELFRALASGDCEALAPLYDLASGRLYALALWRTGSHEAADEVVQEVFVRVATQRDRLTTVRDPRWWLVAVTDRLAVDALRRASRRRHDGLEDHAERPAEPVDLDRAIDAGVAWALLARLPAKQRDVVYLHHAAGMSHAEVGRCLGIPAFTAASRYRLGLAGLRRLLGGTR